MLLKMEGKRLNIQQPHSLSPVFLLRALLFAHNVQGADMLLLGGDVFHDNKPSRRTMHQVHFSFYTKSPVCCLRTESFSR